MNWQSCIEHSIKYKSSPPDSYFYKLKALDVGHEGQSILLLTTSNAKLAFDFAKRGLQVTAIDSCLEIIEEAKEQAQGLGLSINFIHSKAEDVSIEAQRFDIVLVHQALKHLLVPKILTEAKRLLNPGGYFVSSNMRWLPRLDIVARKSEEVILTYNPKWADFDFTGEIYPMPKWAEQYLLLKGMFFYDESLSFQPKTWAGRLKASSFICGTLSHSKVLDFEKDLIAMLEQITFDDIEIRHRIDAHIFQFK